MDLQEFLIPKQTDESLILALATIRDEFQLAKLFIQVWPHFNAGAISIQDKEPLKAAAIAYVLSERSEIMPYFGLIDIAGSHTALRIDRQPGQIMDKVTVYWNEWGRQLPQHNGSQAYVRLMALARKRLRAVEAEASFSGMADNEWTRYRDSQTAILNSLQETAKSVLVDSNRRALEAEATAKSKCQELEGELKKKYESEQERLAAEHGQKLKVLQERETALRKREESFNTKEARYVARQAQQDQIEQIKQWLQKWSLTDGTTRKRWSVTGIYILALIATGGVTIWFSVQSFGLLKGVDLTKLSWWQWALLTVKPILPFAAFTTFLIYFIRWSSAWSRQHADEEFRNRARVLDIGRSAWLLEAVRDAQDNQKELPPDLVRELSKNLFAQNAGPDGADLYPEAISDLLLQGLSSLRVKSSDGTEVEAKRGK